MSEHDHTEFAPPAITGPGWYRDPAPDAPVYGRRYWDGEQWTDQISPQPVRPVTGAVSAPMPPTPTAATGAAAGTAAGGSVGGPASSSQLLTLPPPTGAPAFSANTPAPGWPPPVLQPYAPAAPPARSNRSLWWGLGIAALCVAIIAGGLVFVGRSGDDSSSNGSASSRESATASVFAPEQPNVVVYVDPFVDGATLSQAFDAANAAITSKGLPFSLAQDLDARTLMLTWHGTDRADFAMDALNARDAVRGLPHVLGVERPSAATAPYCGTVPRPDMDSNAQAVARALVHLYLGEQGLSYKIHQLSDTVGEADQLVQIRIDDAFINELAAVPLDGVAKQHRDRVLQLRRQYDATLQTAAQILRDSQPGFRRTSDQGVVQRDASTDELDVLRHDLGFTPSHCRFLAP
jgi:Protein of unknown function (DUF2510)